MSQTLIIGGAMLFGLVVGSFCNVCIYRLPRAESVVLPGSRCPKCQIPIRPMDNIPLVSYLLLCGRCRSCNAPIAWRYPVVELLTGLLFAFAIARLGLNWWSVVVLAFLGALVVVTFIDLEHQIVPDVITLPGIGLGLALSLVSGDPPFLQALLGAVIGGGIFYLVAVASRGGMGGGDIKLTAMIGAFLGWRLVLLTIFLGTLIGSGVAVTLLLLGRKGRKDLIPFGPFLALGATIAVFWGEDLIRWYWRFFGVV
ncbi:MAG: prepilin peptidase [Candidatus Methylomirabilales bacterium]